MISKAELLKKLKQALNVEEKGVEIYTGHIASALPWTGLEKKKTEEAKDILKILGDDSKRHARVILNLIKKVEGDPRDAF